MTARRATFTVSIDLAKGTKEAHMVTIEKIGKTVARFAQDEFEARGYTVRKANVNVMLHYVRHSKTIVVKTARHLKSVI